MDIRYCARFIGDTWENLVLAAGTVFNQVVIWKPCSGEEGDKKVLHRLPGHQVIVIYMFVDQRMVT